MSTNEWLEEHPEMTFLDAVYLIPKDEIREVFPEKTEDEILEAWQKGQELLNFCLADVPNPYKPGTLDQLLAETEQRAKERFPGFSDFTLGIIMGKVHNYVSA